MKRINTLFVVMMLSLAAAAGCTAADESPANRVDTAAPADTAGQSAEKDRVIAELTKERDELKAAVAKLEAQAAKQPAVEPQPTVEPQPSCPAIDMKQGKLKAEDYAGYLQVNMPCYSIYIPVEWSYRMLGGELEFIDDRTIVGKTEVVSYLNRNGAEHYVANHMEQKGFEDLGSIVPISGTDVEAYRIRLQWEKPAADHDPDWKYDETRVYISMKQLERSFGFCFSTEDVPEETIRRIVRSFRLKAF